MIGTCLQQRYTLHVLLRQRRDCHTYLAWDKQRCVQVVIKILPFAYGFDWENLTRFERESNVLRQLSHPAIPEYLDSFSIDLSDFKGFALVQTFIQAKSLAEHIQQGRTFSEADIVQIAKALLDVLIFLHGRNPAVIHRDIKPSNILLSNRSGHSCGTVYLIDFGAIQTHAYKTEGTITIAGTFGYGAPEQFRGEAIASSDLYGLGMTLVYLVTGVAPTHLPIRNGKLIFESPQLSTHLTNWIKGLIQPDSHRRFATARMALNALAQTDFKISQLASYQQQPAYSNLLFSKTSQALSFTISPIGFSFKNAWGLALGSGLMLMFAWVWLIPILGWYMGYITILHYLKAIRDVLIATFGHSQLTVTSSELAWTSRWGILRANEEKLALADLSRLEWLSPRLIVREDSEGTSTVEVPSELRVHAGNKILKWAAHSLNSPNLDLHCFTLAELHWIAAELGDWLDMPIEQESVFVQVNPQARNR
jgi:serine/threonine protein kinase